MQIFLLTSYLLLLHSFIASANVEKTVFLGPGQTHESVIHPDVSSLLYDVLTPSNPIVRRDLAAAFPSADNLWKGSESWILLDELQQGRRYEVRICWSATQPTAFALSAYDPVDVFGSTELNTSLYAHAETGHVKSTSNDSPGSEYLKSPELVQPFHGLFLHIIAKADYFTTNGLLMQTVPPVKVDIILDPYVFNLLPRSLLPTVLYLALLVIVAWILSKYIWNGLESLAEPNRRTSTIDEIHNKSKKAD